MIMCNIITIVPHPKPDEVKFLAPDHTQNRHIGSLVQAAHAHRRHFASEIHLYPQNIVLILLNWAYV